MNKSAHQTRHTHMHMLACMHTHLVSSAKKKSLETILLIIICSLEVFFLCHKFSPTVFDHDVLPITTHSFREKEKFQPLYGLHELINFENDTLHQLALLQYNVYRHVFHLRLHVIRSRCDRGQDRIQTDQSQNPSQSSLKALSRIIVFLHMEGKEPRLSLCGNHSKAHNCAE